jgi:hypothetical protein
MNREEGTSMRREEPINESKNHWKPERNRKRQKGKEGVIER